MHRKQVRSLTIAAAATAGAIFYRSASAQTSVTLLTTNAANWSTAGIWSDGSNPASNTAPTTTDAYQVSAGQILNAPSLTAAGTDPFYGASLSLTSATLNFPGSSGGTIIRNDSFGGQVVITDSSLVFTSTNATTHNISGGLVFADTSGHSNTLTMVSSSFTQNLTINGTVSGSGTINFNLSGSASGRNVNIVHTGSTYSGAIVMGSTPGATTFNLNQTLGNVSSYTIATSWTLADALSNNINGSNMVVTGALKIAGTSELLGNLTGAGSVTASNSSATSLTLNGAGTFSGTMNNGAGALSVTKTGSGTQALSGTVNYTGTTNISGGMLQFGSELSLYDNQSGNWTAANITVGSGATLGLSVGGTGQFTTSDVGTLLTNLGTGAGGFQSGSFIALDTTGGNFNYSTPITNVNGGANSIGLIRLGTGFLTLQSANTYTGFTAVNGGTLILDSSNGNTGSIGLSATTIGSGATLLVKGNSSTGALTVIGGATIATQGALDLRDGSINTLNIGGTLSLGNNSKGSILGFDLGTVSGSNDALNVTGAVSAVGVTTINLNALGTLVYGTYTLITDTSGGLTGGTGFTLGSRPSGPNYSLSSSTANALILTVSIANTTPTTAYWTGIASRAGGDTSNNWGFTGSPTNWSSTPNGLTDTGAQPGSITNVIFAGANANAVSGVLSTQLDNNYSLNSLTFDTSPAPSVTAVALSTNGYTLNIGSAGLLLAGTDTSSATINGNAATLALGASQTWANNSSTQSLTVNAGITGTAGASATQTLTFGGNGSGGVTVNGAIADGFNGGNVALVFNQTGVTLINGVNSFTGGITLNSGTIRLGSTGALNSVSPNNLTFGPGATADLQLNGNSTRVLSLNSDPTTPGSPIIENANASASVLTALIPSATDTYAGVLRDGTGGGALGLTLSGAGVLILSGTNAYTGPTTLAGGTLIESTAGSLPAASPVVFTGTATLNMSGQAFTPPSLAVAGSGTLTATITGASSVALNSTGTTVIGATVSGNTDTLDVSSSSSFTYNGSSAAVLVLGGGNATGGNGTLLLSTISHITAGTLDLGTSPTSLTGGNGYTTTGILDLGTTNTINANTITIGNHPGGTSNGTLTFASGLTNPTVTISGFAGGISTANIVIGESSSSDYSTAAGVVDLTAGTVNASIGTLSIGIHAYNNLNFNENGSGAFNMGAGTVSAQTIILGQTIPGGTNAGRTTSLATGTFNLGTSSVPGGTLLVNTLTMGDQQLEKTSTSAVTSIFNFNGGLLEAAVIQPGATQTSSAGAVTRQFNWNAGTIQNYNAGTGLTISIPTITIASSSTNTFDITAGQSGTVSSNMSGGAIIKADSGLLTLSGSNTYTGGTTVNGGTLSLTSPTAFPAFTALTIGANAKTSVANYNVGSSRNTPAINTLSVAGTTGAWTGKLDLGNNDLIVRGGTVATLNDQLLQGRNHGNWNGSGGITSNAAASDSTHLTALGMMVNDDGTGNAIYGSFDNISSNDGDLLVKYTYYGDADLSGVVDGSDYTRIDNGYLSHLTGWYNGDFNYDGIVNGSDYTLIDNAFNTQGASLQSEIATATTQIAGGSSASAVPEPTMIGLVGLGATALLSRRRRRSH